MKFKIVKKDIKMYDAVEGVHEDLYKGFLGIINEETNEIILDFQYAFIDRFYLANFDNDQFIEGDALFKIYETESEWYHDIAQYGYVKNDKLIVSKLKYPKLKFFYKNYCLTSKNEEAVIIDLEENVISQSEFKKIIPKMTELDNTFDLLFEWEHSVDNDIIKNLETNKKENKSEFQVINIHDAGKPVPIHLMTGLPSVYYWKLRLK